VNIVDVFASEALLGPSIIQRNPSAELLRYYTSLAAYQNPLGIETSTLGAIFDSRSHNLSEVATSGVDLNISYRHQISFGDLYGALAGTRILRFENRFSSTAPTQSVLDTPYQPTRLKLRAETSFARGPLNVSLYLNYVSAYTDNRVEPTVPVASWTTADASLSYDFGGIGELLRNSKVVFGVTNIADRAPPYLANPVYRIFFDGSNADPLGRHYSIQLSKRW
jgi:hypothetical protein